MLSSLALVVVIVIDQFRTDEYLRARSQLSKAGIVKIVDQGIFYDDAHHTQFFDMTCPGHVALSTGAQPGLNGIMINDEWDTQNHKRVYCVADPDHKWLSADADNEEGYIGTSGKRIMTTTVGDELKSLWPDDSRLVSVALKDRSAIALAGHAGDGVYFFAPKTKIWTTSTAYTKSKTLPEWLIGFNKKNDERNRKLAKPRRYNISDEVVGDTTEVALLAAKAEKLGQHKHTDTLWVSYSNHDYISHEFGDDSEELKTNLKLEDQNIARLISELQKQVGKKKLMVILTADHGAGTDIRVAKKLTLPGGKLNADKTKADVNACLAKSGGGSVEYINSMLYFLGPDAKDKAQSRLKLKECLNSFTDSRWHAFTREEILSNQIPNTPWLKNLGSSYYPSRGPDVVGLLLPGWNSNNDMVVSHETPYDYDSWVPLAFWWPGIKARQVHKRVDVTSLAPTLSRILETRKPSGAMSELLTEVLDATH